jgi:hypothetical protein
MLDIVGLAIWLGLLALLLPRPWLACRGYLDAIVILRVPLLVLAVALLLNRNEQMREILAITYLSSTNPWQLLAPVLSYLLVASSLWFWSGVFCDVHADELKSLRWAWLIPSLIPSAFLAIVAFNVCRAALGAGTGASLLIAGAFLVGATGLWAIGDSLYRSAEALASQGFRQLAAEYFGSMGTYFAALGDWLGSRVPRFNPFLAVVGALVSLPLAPFVAAIVPLGWLSRSFNALRRTTVRLAGKPVEEPRPAPAAKDEPVIHPWWIEWVVWLDRSLARLNRSYAAEIGRALPASTVPSDAIRSGIGLRGSPLRPPSRSANEVAPVAGDVTRPGTGLPGSLLRPPGKPSNEASELLRSSTPALKWALVLASGTLALAIAPELAKTRVFQLYLYGVAGIFATLLFGSAWAFIAGLLVPGCALLLFILVPGLAVQTAGALGVIAICNAFLLACLALFCLLWLLGRATGRPIMTILVGSMLLLSSCDLNDNHAIRAIDRAGTGGWESKSLLAAFDAWLDARKDKADFAAGTYPVYIVAARGGGMYAAQHTARFLARAQDLYPNFAHHVFAVSAVSGGSIGASLFSALVNERQRQLGASPPLVAAAAGERWFEEHANAFLDNDFLASVTAATLFRDTVARLIPCLDVSVGQVRLCPTAFLDRARAFEETLELTWDARAPHLGAKTNPFRDSFARHWDPAGGSPALLLNTTEVETGERVVLAPFKLENEDVPSLLSLTERAPELHVSLSTAAGLSARFPGIGSAGWYHARTAGGKVKRRLVDGGYFDNSGVATALDVIAVIRRQRPQASLILIALTGADGETADTPDYGFGEIMSPLRTLEGIRRTRADLAIEQAHRTLDGARCRIGTGEEPAPCAYEGSVRQTALAAGDRLLPLGWFLSKRSRDRIAWSVGEPDLCGVATVPPSASLRERSAAHVRSSNSCLLRKVGDELRGGGRRPE